MAWPLGSADAVVLERADAKLAIDLLVLVDPNKRARGYGPYSVPAGSWDVRHAVERATVRPVFYARRFGRVPGGGCRRGRAVAYGLATDRRRAAYSISSAPRSATGTGCRYTWVSAADLRIPLTRVIDGARPDLSRD